MKLLSTKQVLIRITAIVASIELLIMLIIGAYPFITHAHLEAVFDVTVLVIFSVPLIYILVVKPFVNARDEALSQINQLANIDPLTQLANRRYLTSFFDKSISDCIRHKHNSALMLVDLDGFKYINDTHGHDAGDAVLIEVGRRLNSITREEDTVGRIGGDEFVAIIHHLDLDKDVACEKALMTAKKLIDLTEQPIDFNNVTLNVSASIGICLFGSEKMDLEAALKKADGAMYQAKQTGKGCARLA